VLPNLTVVTFERFVPDMVIVLLGFPYGPGEVDVIVGVFDTNVIV
jgi:hypothetical protein